MKTKDIKKYFEAQRRNTQIISVSLNKDKIDELKKIAEHHELPLSVIVEACVELGLSDPYINPPKKEDAFE